MKDLSPGDYSRRFIPRVPSQPWSAPAYDEAMQVPTDPPRLFCMSALAGQDVHGAHLEPSCTCITEQGTRYEVDPGTCFFIARRGQYEPFRDERGGQFADGDTQIDQLKQEVAQRQQGATIDGKMANVGEVRNEIKSPPSTL